ncbi:MAG TPA: cobalamin-binding protein [Saprospiraceae bacterium]|nr:cobalamin-binding protein [Saprospiraceae bacterium]HPI05913.1 cobalamin-binding protein [Saprospiraceae bacterium]
MKEFNFPRRIVSLVPSQTELLAYLGLQEEVVGITKFCVHPAEWFQNKQRVGGTKTVNFEKTAALQPDLILANKEENERTQIEELQKHFPVWISDILTLEDALDMIRQVGGMTGKTEPAQALAVEIVRRFEGLKKEPFKTVRAAYLIWRKPYMVAARNTFVDEMMQWAGFVNVFAGLQRYPEISADALVAAAPEVVLLSSEPYPFAEKHLHAIRELCPAASVLLVDGEMFSWYGSRLLQAPAYFQALRQRVGKG